MRMRGRCPRHYKRVHQGWMVSCLRSTLRRKSYTGIASLGRAKVFAFRGKYRHYFLRVTPEDGIECNPANLVVSPELTLELYVEDVSALLRYVLFLIDDRRV